MAEDIFNNLLDGVTTGEVKLDNVAPANDTDSIFNSVLDDVSQSVQTENRVAAMRGVEAMPQQFAEHTRLAKTFGVPVDFVGRNEEALKRFDGIKDITRLLDDNPVLSKWYKAEDNNVAIEVDELRNMSGLSWLGQSAVAGVQTGRGDVELANLRYRELMGSASNVDTARADILSQDRSPRSYGADGWFSGGWVGAAQQMPIMFETFLGGLEGGLQGAAAGAAAGALAGGVGAFPAAASGYKAGSFYGQTMASFRLEAGLSYDEFKNFKDETGAYLDNDTARTAAILSGAASALLETVAFRQLAKTVPGLDKVVNGFGSDVVKSALRNPTTREAFKQFGMNIMKTGATEITTEVMQEAISMFAGEAAKLWAGSDGAEFAMISGTEAADRLKETAIETAKTMTIMGPALSSTRLGHDVSRARTASRDAAVIEAIHNHAEGNPLNERLPEKAKEAVRAITENGPIQSVFVSPEALQTYFQSDAEILQYVEQVGLRDEYVEAARLGRDIEIPIDVYYTNIAASEMGQHMKQYAKFSPENMSTVDAGVFNEAWAEAQAALQSDYQAQIDKNYIDLEGAAMVHRDVKDRAMDAGIVPDQAEQYATLYSTFFRVMGERTGEAADGLYAKYGFDIKRDLPSMTPFEAPDAFSLGLDVIRKGGVDKLRKQVKKSQGPSLVDAVRKRGGIFDDGGELKAMGANKVVRKAGDFDAGDNQYSADDTARQMWEEGYFPEFKDRPTANDLFAAIRDELGGQPRRSIQYDESGNDANIRARSLVEMADALDQLGLDPSVLDNATIRAEIDRITNDDPDTGAIYQSALQAVAEGSKEVATESAEFKKWFGDSKVVDSKGNPRVVYHGTDADFGAFDPDKGGSNTGDTDASGGFFFSTSPVIAEGYSTLGFGNPNIMPVYLSIKNPYTADMHGTEYDAGLYENIIKTAKEDGHDGVVLNNVRDGIYDDSPKSGIFVVFKPNQIKSVNNRGTFDAGDDRILYQDGGIKRGSIQLSENKTVINLFEAADLSTFLHESGHFFLEVFKDLATQEMNIDTDAMPKLPAVADGFTRFYHGGGGDLGNISELQDLWLTPQYEYARDYRRGASDNNVWYVDIDTNRLQEIGLQNETNGYLQAAKAPADIAQSVQPVNNNAPSKLASDWQATKEYLGIGDDNVLTTEAHEKWARTFEAYLFEGKAPSNEVASIMSRFRSWLTFVYQNIAKLNVPINDKIRGVMDRLITSDEEIKSASFSPEFRPAFKDAAEAGMSEAQWKDYLDVAGRAVERTRRDLDARMLQDVAREATAEWKSAKKEIRDEVQAELEGLPVYQALTYLRTGKSSLMPEGMERLHLDRDAIVSVMGEGALEKMPRGVPPLYRAKGGVHPDVLAELMGFKSGSDMLSQIMGVPSLQRNVVEETNIRMRQRYGDLMGDAVARSREVTAAIANDATGDLLATEMEVLMRKGLVSTKINKADARRVAREMIRAKTIRDAVKTKLYMTANDKAAAETERHIMKGDWVKAAAAKQRQLLNHYMSMESIEAEKDTTSAVKYLNKFSGRTRPKGIDAEYIDQIESLLERFDFRKSVTMKDETRRISLASWIQDQEALGAIVSIPDTLRNDAFRKPYRQMTVDDLLAVRDAVKNIEHIGRLKDKLLSGKKQREFNAIRDELIASIAASQESRKEPKTRNPTTYDKTISQMKSLEATLLKMEQVFDWMDGGDINGPLRRNVWQAIANAEVAENEMRKKYVTKIMSAFKSLDQERLRERITIAGINQTFLRSDIMAVALNMGNEGNLSKMLRGETWSQQQLDNVVSHLNEQEWNAVQDMWDTINELWPDIAALQKRLTGVIPEKVESRTVQTPFGELEGGYYPLIYDPLRSADVEDRGAAAADRLFENTYLRPETQHGFTKERSQAYTRPLLFDINGAAQHITNVIHDLTHREAIMDSYKLLTNPEVRAEIEGTYGREIYQQLVPWLQSIAHDGYKNDGLKGAERFMKGVRTRSTLMAMGFRVSTIITQLAGVSSAMEMVSIKSTVGAIKDFTMAPMETWQMVNSLSGEMRFRSDNLDRDIKERLRDLTGATSAADRARRFAFYGIGVMDRVVTVPMWMAAYRDHLAKLPTDHEGAVAHADKVIRLSQGSGGAKDLAAVQRNNELTKMLTMFYSYFGAYYNRQRAWGRDAKRAIQAREFREFPELLARQVFMTIGPAILGELLVGRGPDDDEEWAAWAMKKIALYPVMAVPIARDAANVFDGGFGYTMSPVSRTIEEVAIRPFQLMGDIADGEFEARKGVKQLINTGGYVFNLPTGQLASSIDNVWQAMDNDDFQLRDILLTRKHK